MPAEAPRRLLLLALDSLPPSVLERWIEDGSLPNLRRLREEGSYGLVSSDADLFPGSVWPTFSSMSDVSEHANYHLVQWDPATRRLRPPGDDWCEILPFWRRLGASGVPTISLDVPFSEKRAGAPNAIEISGWGMHEGVWQRSHPDGMLDDIRRRHGRSSQIREGPGERGDAEALSELPGLIDDVGRRAAIIMDMATRLDWRVFLAVFTETHRTAHWLWGSHWTGEPQGAVKDVARAFDEALPNLKAILRPQDVMVVFSLHGMEDGNDTDRLEEASLLYLTPPRSRGLGRRLDPVYLLRRGLPLGTVRRIARALPQSLYNWTYYRLQNNHGDWSEADWAVQPLDHRVYVHSTLSEPEALESQLAWLDSQFRGLLSANGAPVVDQITYTRQLYQGRRLDLLPHLVIRPFNRTIGPEVILPDGSRRPAPRHDSRDGQHASGGFFILSREGLSQGSAAIAGEDLASFFAQTVGLDLKAINANR
jgi:hypothetical protein